ncbi:MAG TPA: pseudoazurin [Rhodospirillaceae bacterium]|nr:pseudoazurin [Rhodospirillaceae bacterium]HAA92894.1 pseudoazurin [Rhodospirillaceae bacterium]HAT35417.1 pseudoazurin [Rhodospirillaceae bacterium]
MRLKYRLGAVFCMLLAAISVLNSKDASAETHTVMMLHRAMATPQVRNVFDPPVIRVKPGDTVRFLAIDKGHNSQSVKGMIPKGAKPWNSAVGKTVEVTLKVPGVYGYICTPHYTVGMVGLIIVEGKDWRSNLESAKKIKHPGRSRTRFRAMFQEVDKFK